mmetsp:Transcript_14670/g.22137  ORF Transcript_14670/g.22137 Transcript_14670/m.22137 type:complete len:139 (+) Transcript_14670:95-511(+)|eukprot:CAMPEP_0185024764 /NCGR_PEP_ID=MMETSP1103-20130426/7977_1 /TAXON_ID=36769 /ORGANISM="Paraphysomonas bandaiensis, Strain Caron Lab Isolate" /LENGTH=138 /DNA_ID=CAMNT_0027557827 /DNA_START=74 /DNA_END=490 /DNA_ORIENTATION=+
MAQTGVTVSDEVINEFNEMKLKRINPKFIVYSIVDGVIVTDMRSESDNFEDFLNALPENDCRYAIYDMDFTTTDGRPGNKLVMVSWAPDTAKVKSKMVYAGSKDALTRSLVGVSTKITATDVSELTVDIMIEACRKFA